MNDLKPFKHGEEGTHALCSKHSIGGKSVCCECSGKTDCGDSLPHTLADVEARFKERFYKPPKGGIRVLERDPVTKEVIASRRADLEDYRSFLLAELTAAYTAGEQAAEERGKRSANSLWLLSIAHLNASARGKILKTHDDLTRRLQERGEK